MKAILIKKGEFNFEWLFAIIVGAAILSLAIYGAVRFGNTLKYQSDTELAKKISIIIDPMQAGFAEGKSSLIRFGQETKINNKCSLGDYGENIISVSTDKGKEGAGISIKNKYIFSSSQLAKDYTVFSMPLEIGFKVSDLLVVLSDKYCFINPPESIGSQIKSLKINNFKVNNENCDNSSIRVCFSSSGKISGKNCNVTVYDLCTNCENNNEYGYVEKNNKRLYYIGNLIYPAIISESSLYNCNVQRLFYRTSTLARLYSKKGDLMGSRQCFSSLKSQLDGFASIMEGAATSERFDSVLVSVYLSAKELYDKNNAESCEIW